MYKFNRLNIVLFLIAILIFAIVIIVLPADPEAPEYENRAMAQLPKMSSANILSGDFTDEFEAYLIDNAAYRTSFLKIASAVEGAYGIKLEGSATPVELNAGDLGMGLLPDEEDDIPNTPSETELPVIIVVSPSPTTEIDNIEEPVDTPEPMESEAPVQTTEEPIEYIPIQKKGGHVDTSIPFGVDVNYNSNAILYERYSRIENRAVTYANALNSYMDKIPENTRVFSLLAPTQVEFMGEEYQSTNDSQYETIQMINGFLDENIITVDAHGQIAAHTNEYLYFRTDHHWTTLGAYYAYLAFAEAAGLTPYYIENYIEHSIPDYIGSLAKGTSNKTILSSADTLYYYELDNGITFSRKMFFIPENLSKLSYRLFLGGDYAKLDFTSTNTNGKTLVVVKDSYANALIPWIAPHYERIIVIDPRQYEGSVISLLEDIEDADLLFVDYVLATEFSDFVLMINNAK